jgi:predicted ATPase
MGVLAFCTGTGRTGKTVVAEVLEKRGWRRHKSPTRDFFQSRGISSETDLFARPQPERAQIQRDYFEFFMEDLNKVVSSGGDNNERIVFERGPVDMFAYLLFHDWAMTLIEYENYIDRIRKFFDRTSYMSWVNGLLLFPFPAPWMKTEDTDKFRHSMFGKDMIINGLVNFIGMEVWEALPGDLHSIGIEIDGTPEERADSIEKQLGDIALQKAVG